MSKRKVVILGGGIAGLTTAWRLTGDPGWQDRFESVVVYQMGWRLGGKCAAGRGPAGRVEEHGIHLFGGGYYNALTMMKSVCEEAYPGSPGEFAHRFQDQYTSIDVVKGKKSVTVFAPGTMTLAEARLLDTPAELFAQALAGVLAQLRSMPAAPQLTLVQHFSNGSVHRLLGLPGPHNEATAGWLTLVETLADQVRQQSNALPATLARLEAIVGPQRVLERVVPFSLLDDLLPLLGAAADKTTQRVGQWMGLLNFAYALGKGYLEDFLRQPNTFSALDQQDYADWLRRHGAWDSTLELDIALSPIRILYQYRGGDARQKANRSMGAGAYLHWTLRTLAYVKAPFWFFVEGTGDTVITPLYTVLAQRGVRFEFFHKVESLQLAADGSRVAQVTLRRQATTRYRNSV